MAAEPSPVGSAIILVVERDPHVRELEQYFLEQAGFTVEFAADGAEALARVQEVRPDLVITEILVPRLDGLSVCRRIKAAPALADVSVLVFSILAAARRAEEAGADAFLMKPLAERSLLRTVEELLAVRNGGRGGRGGGAGGGSAENPPSGAPDEAEKGDNP